MSLVRVKFAAAVTLIEVIVAMVALAVAAMGALGYQYHAAVQARIAHAQTTSTTVLAENVSVGDDDDAGAFSHTTLNGVGQGCVRINITLTDPKDDDSIQVKTTAMMRNIWPR